jgi:glutaredoxin 3
VALIEIFTGPNCGYCARAKAILDSRGLAYRDRDISTANGHREELIGRLPRVRAIPQIFIAGEHIGGCEDLQIIAESGKLDELMGQVSQ